MIPAAVLFLEQNEIAAQTLLIHEVEPYAQHHAGGLYVLVEHLGGTRYVKLHDTWDDGGPVIVHVYDTDDPLGEERVWHHPDGRTALYRFLVIATEAGK